MANRAYDQARADFEYLETLAEMDPMRSPTKYTTLKLYITAIDRWFNEAVITGRELTPRAVAIQSTWCRTSGTPAAYGASPSSTDGGKNGG